MTVLKKEKLCFVCKKPGQISVNCPSWTKHDDKISTKGNDDTLCFLGEDTIFSHPNRKWKILHVHWTIYSIWEGQIVWWTGFSQTHHGMWKPIWITGMGRNIVGFQYWKLKWHVSSIMKHGMYENFSQNRDAKMTLFKQATEYLQKHQEIHIGGVDVILQTSLFWLQKNGKENPMGRLLMEIREELVYDSESDVEDISMLASDIYCMHSVTNEHGLIVHVSQGVPDASASTPVFFKLLRDLNVRSPLCHRHRQSMHHYGDQESDTCAWL